MQLNWQIQVGSYVMGKHTDIQPTKMTFSFFYVGQSVMLGGGNHLSPTESSFRVPDLRGLFLRGVTLSSSSDPDASTRTKIFPTDNFGERGNQVGSFQKDELKTHHHKTIGQRKAYGALGVSDAGACPEYGTSDTDFYGGNESRPKNANVHYLIKAVHQSLNLQQLLTDNNILD
jgi:hypothetical protein